MPDTTRRREAETVPVADGKGGPAPGRPVGLTLLHHPDPRRVGEVARLMELRSGQRRTFNRLEPRFTPVEGGAGDCLATSFLSRRPVTVTARRDGTVQLSHDGDVELWLDGQPAPRRVDLAPAALEAGVVLTLSRCVVLLLHLPLRDSPRHADLGLVGTSPAMDALRSQIQRVADLDVTVLLRGESGTGKELVAQAIHAGSHRAGGPYVVVNMAAIPASMGSAELFGHEKGAFTGAAHSRQGYFRRADGGTLFLDEIGDVPLESQPLLLRAIEEGEIQTVGADRPHTVDVRLIAATDADLEQAVADGRFRQPLLQRLAGYEIEVPPLRRRRDDIGRLLWHFLAEELQRVGDRHRLDEADPEGSPWMPAAFADRIARFDWPGNVRQLRNLARQLAITNRGADHFQVDPAVERLLAERDDEPTWSGDGEEDSLVRRRTLGRAAAELDDDTILEALRRNRFQINATAADLNVSRSWLFTRIDKSDRIRKARDLDAAEIRAAARDCGDDLAEMAQRLEVSLHGLKQRMKELGLR